MNSLKDRILKLKAERNAVIIAHNYQRPEVQEIADYIGDSLELALKVKDLDVEVIVFCGVKFMAETAKLLAPSKKVLLPRPDAGCQLADTITPADVQKLREKFPDSVFVCYVNTSVEVKAYCDICCTSANAVQLVSKLPPEKHVVFLPDRNLGAYVRKTTGRDITIWDGYCYVHEQFSEHEAISARREYPDYEILVHPECKAEVIELADHALGTAGMVKRVRGTQKRGFVIGTEEGMITRLKREFPERDFISLGKPKVCVDMKKITLEDVLHSLENLYYQVEIPTNIAQRAYRTVQNMLELMKST